MAAMPEPVTYSPDDLGHALREALDFTEALPDPAPTVFALVPTAVLAQIQPDAVTEGDDSVLSLLAEEPLHVADGVEPLSALEEFVATASWPEPVVGVAVVAPIVILPPEAKASLPGDTDSGHDLRSAAHSHPQAQSARIAVGALRGGRTLALLDIPTAPADPADPSRRELRTHPELATELQRALAATLN